MTAHLSSSHPSVVFLDPSGGNTSTQKWLLKRKTHLSKASCCWNTVVWEPREAAGSALAIRYEIGANSRVVCTVFMDYHIVTSLGS